MDDDGNSDATATGVISAASTKVRLIVARTMALKSTSNRHVVAVLLQASQASPESPLRRRG